MSEYVVSKRMKAVNLAIYGIFVMIGAAMLLVIFWLLYPYKTADIYEPIPVLNKNHQVAPEEAIVMKLAITKYNLFPLDTNNSILCSNGRIYTIGSIVPNGKAILPVGKFTRIQDSYHLPGDAEVGSTCHFEFQNTYKVNPIRNIIKTWKSENFSVKEK